MEIDQSTNFSNSEIIKNLKILAKLKRIKFYEAKNLFMHYVKASDYSTACIKLANTANDFTCTIKILRQVKTKTLNKKTCSQEKLQSIFDDLRFDASRYPALFKDYLTAYDFYISDNYFCY